MAKPSRWAAFNHIVDEFGPDLTPAEFRLLVVIFRHSEFLNSSPLSPENGHWRNVFTMSDGKLCKRLKVTKQAIQRTRTRLMNKGVVNVLKTRNRWVWYIGEPLPEGTTTGTQK